MESREFGWQWKKYEGHMTIKQENNWFIVSILIPIPEKQNQTAL